MNDIYDRIADEECRLCNLHRREDCEVCSPLFCRHCAKEIDIGNPESFDWPGLCEKCSEEMSKC